MTFKKGNKPWNKELTKENCKKLKEIGKSISLAKMGKSIMPCSEEHKINLGLSNIGKNKGKKRTKAQIKKMSLIQIGEKNSMYGKERPDTKKRMLEGGALKARKCVKSYKNKINKPESILKSIIEKTNLPFNYVGDGAIWLNSNNHSFNPDFLSKNPKHIIEVFGDYWHNLLHIKKRDKERLQTYKKYGYKTLVIWEHELKNEDIVLNKIRRFIN